ncbi:MAG: hypothetical protein GY714_22445 [Desulfobacterales bacterium]|nr:hypothetical protein [Desulfobacterales bacterium]
MEHFFTFDYLKNISILKNQYMYAVLTYLLASLFIGIIKNEIFKKIVIIITPLTASFFLFYFDFSLMDYSNRYFTLTDLFHKLILIISFSLSVLNLKSDNRLHSLFFLMIAAAIASISTVNLIQCFFFYFFICYIPFFTIIKINGNFNKYSTFLIISLIIDMFLVAGVSYFTGEINFIINDNIKYFIIIPLLLKASVIPLHFLFQSLISKVEYNIYIMYVTTVSIVTLYIIIQKFSGSDILIYAGYSTAIYTLLFAIIHNDIRYIVNLLFVSQIAAILSVTGLFNEIYVVNDFIIASLISSVMMIFVISDIIKKRKITNLDDCKGLYQIMPYHLCFLVVCLVIISGMPVLSYFNSIQTVVTRLNFKYFSFWYKGFVYIYLSLLFIAVIRIIYYFLKENEIVGEKEKINYGIFLLLAFYIVLKFTLFEQQDIKYEIFSDYFQVFVVSLIVFNFLKTIIKAEKGSFYTIEKIIDLVKYVNNQMVKPAYTKSEKTFDSALNTQLKFDMKIFRYFDIFEKQITEKFKDMNSLIKSYSKELNNINSLKTRYYSGLMILIIAFLIFIVVIL